MAPTFSQFQGLRLITEFIDGGYKHTITDKPLRCETWTRTEMLGEGTYGTVYKEICAENKKLRAVKEVKKSFARSNELAILAQLRSHPEYFVQLVGWFEDERSIYLAMEYLPGDLDALLKESKISEDDTKRVTKQILSGLEIMHKKDICHRDLKPGNILIANWIPISVKIADFGVSKHFDGITQGRTTAGTKPFMAPEVWGFGNNESSEYTTAVDMWSLGCLVYFMLTNRTPFPEPRDLINFIQGRDKFPPRSAYNIPHQAIGFMATLLRPLPENRASALKAQQHSWLLPKEENETVWTLASPEPNTPALGSTGEWDFVTPPASLVVPAADKKQRSHSPLGRREAIQHLFVAAAAAGNCELLRAQLEKGATPMGDVSGNTPIYLASRSGHISAVKLLLQKGAHIRVAGSRHHSALHGAAEGGNHQLAKYLLDMGADIEARDSNKESALSLATKEGHYKTVKLLLGKGATISEIVGSDGCTVLLHAARQGDLEITRLLLELGAVISAKRQSDGWNALHIAARYGHQEVIRLLLDRRVNMSERTNEGYCVHHIATHYGNLAALKVLLDAGADISETEGSEGWTLLRLAACRGHLDITRFLLDKGAEISTKSPKEGWTALHAAARYGHSEVVRLLLQRGADMSDKTYEGYCAHHLSANCGHFAALKVLVDGGANISETGGLDIGWTALHLAVWDGYLDMTRFLLNMGANISAKKQSDGMDALQVAADKGHLDLVRLLLERGADTTQTTNSGETALSLAVAKGYTDIVLILIDWSEKHMTITPTELDNLKISEDQKHNHTRASTGKESNTSPNSTIDST